MKKNLGFTKAKNLTQPTVSIRWVDFFGDFWRKFEFLDKHYFYNFIVYQAEEVVKKLGQPISCQGPFKDKVGAWNGTVITLEVLTVLCTQESQCH